MQKRFSRGLIFKLGGVLLLLLFIKLLMIGVGIYSAGHLAGDATAINWAGSERMRSYKLSLLLNKWLISEGEERSALSKDIQTEISRFEDILKYLREGETSDGNSRYEEPKLLAAVIKLHPTFQYFLSLPGIYEPELKVHVEDVRRSWFFKMKPFIVDIISGNEESSALDNFRHFESILPLFVDEVDHLVALLEDSSNRKVKLFNRLQYLFLLLTILVTMIALYIIFLVTKKSVHILMEGIRAMTAGDFSKRVNLSTNDEMGELASGLNFMAERLEDLYGDLESKVREKTSELEGRNRELSVLYKTVASLSKPLPIEDMLNIYLDRLLEYLGIRSAAIRLFDEDGSLRLAASYGLDEHFKASISFGECLCGILTKNHVSSPWHITEISDTIMPKDCKNCSYRAVVDIPIIYQGSSLGFVHIFQDNLRDFSESEKILVGSLNSHLGAAIDHYNLNLKTRRLALMEERNMLASELHDSIAQALAYLKIQGTLLEESLVADNVEQAMDDLAQIRKGIEKSNKDVRELLLHFRTKIDSEGLEPALRKLVMQFRKETGIKAMLSVDSGLPVLSPGEEIHVFHIVQEALANARKYAQAREVKVLVNNSDGINISIEDDGVGFDVEAVRGKGTSHVGMDIMKERAARLGADFLVSTSPGKGTRVSLAIPGVSA